MEKRLFESFKLYFPPFARRTVKYAAENQFDLIVTLDDGMVLLYDDSENTIRTLPSDSNNMEEDDFRAEFASRLRKRMYRTGISQLELSERTGIPVPMISNYMTGKNTPSFYKVDKIAKALGCSVDVLRYI